MANHERQSRPPAAATSLPDSPAPGPSRSTKPRLLRRLLAPALVACIGIVAGLVLFNMLHRWELGQATKEFQGDAQERVAAFERHMDLHLRSLHTAEAFVLSSEKIDREALSTFADVLLKPEPERQQLGWIDRVPGAQRQAYEQARRDDGLTDFELWQWRKDGHTIMPAAEEYFPIGVIQPPVAWSFPGLDLSSNPACRAALEQARDTGVMIATAPFHLTEEKSDRHNMVIFLPVYAKGTPTTSTAERRENLVGFVFGKYLTKDILAHAFKRLTPEGVDVLVLDPSAIPANQFLGVHWSRLGELPAQARSLDPTIWRDDKFCQATTLEIAGRSFLVLCKPAQGLIAAKMTWTPWLSMLSTWGLTLLLVAYLQTIRTARSRTEVLAMELADANEDLLREMHERESADVALRGNEANLRRAQELAHVGSWLWRLADNSYELSDEMRRIYGLSEADVFGDINSLINAITHPDDREILHKTAAAVAAGEIDSDENLTFRIVPPGGEVRWIVATPARPVQFDDNGNPLVMMGTVHDITDRIHAENALRESQQRLKALVENIPGVAYRCACDEHWTMEIISEEIKQLCGYPASDFVANAVRSFASIIHPDDVKMVTQAVLESVGNRRPYVVAYRLLNADGQARWVLDNGQGVFDDEQLLWLDGVIIDITAQKEAEQALRESEQRYRAIFESAAEGIIIVDTETKKFLFANPAVSAMLGYSEGELLNMSVEDLHKPEDLPPLVAQFESAAIGTTKVSLGIPFVRKDGTVIFVDINTGTMLLDGRRSLVGLFTDVTERKATQDALRESEKRYRQLVESLSEGIVAMDRDGIITFVNSALERILDDRAEMLLGSDFFGSINTFQKEDFRHRFTDEDVGGQEFQLMYLRRDGKLVYLSIRGSAISDDEGNHVGTLAVINDITQRRMAEESLKAAHRQLMFAGEEERHALATDLHDSLGQQAVAMHLTIENLLGRARKADSAYAADLARLSHACQSLTEDIRTACHGLFPPALETLGLCAALRRLVSDCQSLINAKITCCPRCEENPRLTPDVEIALFRIAQEAINNVLRHGNAKDLELTMEMIDDDVIMTVANDGDGFDVEQAESSGLGLLTMRERANAVNGYLTVSSTPGRTTVVARVPMSPPDG